MISVYLDQILNDWISARKDRERQTAHFHDQLTEQALQLTQTVHQNRLRVSETKKEFIQNLNTNEHRWEERLHHVDEWEDALQKIKLNLQELHGISSHVQHLERLTKHEPRFSDRLREAMTTLRHDQTVFHEQLMKWKSKLIPKRLELTRFEPRIKEYGHAEVSRAVYDPEKRFLQDSKDEQQLLQQQMTTLRHRIHRMYRRFEWIETKTNQNSSHYTSSYEKQLLMPTNLWKLEVNDVRQAVLADALEFENARRTLNEIEDILKRLRAIETISIRKANFLDRILNLN